MREEDSIAFVNLTYKWQANTMGLTAINKAHTVSFGISSSAVPIAEIDSYVSGCQFLLRPPGKTNLEYTLTRNASSQGFGTISIEQYNQVIQYPGCRNLSYLPGQGYQGKRSFLYGRRDV